MSLQRLGKEKRTTSSVLGRESPAKINSSI